MRITKRQLRRIIQEELSRELKTLTEGYTVPSFPNSASMEDWVDELIGEDPDAEVDTDVIDPESGEIVISAGESPREQPWWQEAADDPYADSEGVAAEEEPEGAFDWDAYDAEVEAKEEVQRQHDAEMEEKVRQSAIDAGMDWAGDTYYDAKNNPDMWKQYNAETAEEYVMAFAQDAAVDLADSVVKWGDSDVVEWFKSHPTKEPSPYARLQTIQDYLRDSVADMVMDGVAQGIERQKKAA
jgi:hypothetical protein